MKLANGILALTLAAVFSGSLAWAQTAAAPAKPETEVRTFYLNNATLGSDEGHDLMNALRSVIDSHDIVYLNSTQNAIIVRAAPDDLALAQKLISDLDRPHKTYRLTYTVTEMDGTRRIGAQHFAMVLIPGQRTTLNEDSKVPIASGTYQAGNGAVQTNFNYMDVGMTFDATVTELGKGVRLQSKVTQAGVAAPEESTSEAKSTADRQVVTRNTSLEGASFLTLGTPMVLGSVDLPGSTRHLEVEALMEEAAR
jgi:hypothetical protein